MTVKWPRLVVDAYWRVAWIDAGPVGKFAFLIIWGYFLYVLGCAVVPNVDTDPRINFSAGAVLWLRAAYIWGHNLVGLYRDERTYRALRRERFRDWTEDDL